MEILITEGKNRGKKYPLKKGLVLGRSKGDILIDDPKASNPHAKVVFKRKKPYLQDLDSKNGTYVNGKIEDFFELKIGLEFRIGEITFRIKSSKKSQKLKTQVQQPSRPDIHWSNLVIDELKSQQKTIKTFSKKLSPILPPCVLHFLTGPQKGTKWTLYFGPRVVGKSSLDLTLLDQNAPDGECFSLLPTKEGKLLFKTLHLDLVLLNNRYQSQKLLEPKDMITFSNTSIKVHFLGS